MQPIINHSWNVSPKSAIKIQDEISKKVRIKPINKRPKIIIGADVAFSEDYAFAGIIVLTFPELEIIEESYACCELKFPYIPGLLSFREIPVILSALEKVNTKKVDLIICDGQGIAHPRRCGIASHLGVLLDVSTIGCAKSHLIGNYKEPEITRGSYSEIKIENDIVGAVVRTKDKVKPVFVSPGHKINLEDSIKIILDCDDGHRIPYPTRIAHIKIEEYKKSKEQEL